ARFSLPRLVRDGAAARRRDPALVSDMDGDASTIRPGLVSLPRGVLDRSFAGLSPPSQQLDLADDHSAWSQQSGRGGAVLAACGNLTPHCLPRSFASRSSAPCRMKIAACSSITSAR